MLKLNRSQRDIPESQQQVKGLPQASAQANQQKLDQSSDSSSISSEHLGESSDNPALLHGKTVCSTNRCIHN